MRMKTMNDFDRGIQFGLMLAIEIEQEPYDKCELFFKSPRCWRAYKSGVLDYRDKIQELYDVGLPNKDED